MFWINYLCIDFVSTVCVNTHGANIFNLTNSSNNPYVLNFAWKQASVLPWLNWSKRCSYEAKIMSSNLIGSIIFSQTMQKKIPALTIFHTLQSNDIKRWLFVVFFFHLYYNNCCSFTSPGTQLWRFWPLFCYLCTKIRNKKLQSVYTNWFVRSELRLLRTWFLNLKIIHADLCINKSCHYQCASTRHLESTCGKPRRWRACCRRVPGGGKHTSWVFWISSFLARSCFCAVAPLACTTRFFWFENICTSVQVNIWIIKSLLLLLFVYFGLRWQSQYIYIQDTFFLINNFYF